MSHRRGESLCDTCRWQIPRPDACAVKAEAAAKARLGAIVLVCPGYTGRREGREYVEEDEGGPR